MKPAQHITAACLFLFALVLNTWAATPPKSVLLWPNGAPGALGATDADKPSLDVYLPEKTDLGTGVLVVPGGGYQFLALDHEGAQVAQWLVERGVAAFVLHYRIAPRYHYPAPIQDGQRAMTSACGRAARARGAFHFNRRSPWARRASLAALKICRSGLSVLCCAAIAPASNRVARPARAKLTLIFMMICTSAPTLIL